MPKRQQNYWIDTKPPGGVRWEVADHGTALNSPDMRNAMFRMYQRYAKQWNDIELDRARSLSEHTHEVCGAKVVGAHRQFVLKSAGDMAALWILELIFARSFSIYYPGLSCGRNALRSPEDIRNIRLHWAGEGQTAFANWVEHERTTNASHGEWTEYRK